MKETIQLRRQMFEISQATHDDQFWEEETLTSVSLGINHGHIIRVLGLLYRSRSCCRTSWGTETQRKERRTRYFVSPPTVLNNLFFYGPGVGQLTASNFRLVADTTDALCCSRVPPLSRTRILFRFAIGHPDALRTRQRRVNLWNSKIEKEEYLLVHNVNSMSPHQLVTHANWTTLSQDGPRNVFINEHERMATVGPEIIFRIYFTILWHFLCLRRIPVVDVLNYYYA